MLYLKSLVNDNDESEEKRTITAIEILIKWRSLGVLLNHLTWFRIIYWLHFHMLIQKRKWCCKQSNIYLWIWLFICLQSSSENPFHSFVFILFFVLYRCQMHTLFASLVPFRNSNRFVFFSFFFYFRRQDNNNSNNNSVTADCCCCCNSRKWQSFSLGTHTHNPHNKIPLWCMCSVCFNILIRDAYKRTIIL